MLPQRKPLKLLLIHLHDMGVMTTLTIHEADIRNWVGEASFSRGKAYYQQGTIMSPWVQGNILKAKCWGSMPHPYHLWVKLGEGGIEAGECSCPVGGGGHCKHAAALLLTWLHEPDSFQQVEPLERALDQKSKDELIMLMRQMVARYPDLEELVYLSPIGEADLTPANADIIQRQVQQALARGDYGHAYYDAAATIADELEAIMSNGDRYREQDDWESAATLYKMVIDEVLDQYTQIYDHEGDLGRIFFEGSELLGECLEHVQQPEVRMDILHTLVNVVNKDTNVGGYGFSDNAYGVVLDQASLAEKAQIVEWVEAELASIKADDDFSSKWHRQAHGRFLLELQEDTLTDEEFIQLCRRAGLLANLIDRLLALGLVNEAIADAKTASDYDLLALADIFVTHGHGTLAEGLVWERTATSKDTRLDGWLKKHALENEDWDQAIAYAENQFWQRPGTELYEEIRSIAEKLGDWPERRQYMLQRLAEKDQHVLLTQIYLLEGDVTAALAALDKVRSMRSVGWGYGGSLTIEVARAAETSHPREAIRLYQQSVERLIAARGRGNYATAAEHLKQVKSLYERLDEMNAWQAYIKSVRNQKPRLPALLDELKQAGL